MSKNISKIYIELPPFECTMKGETDGYRVGDIQKDRKTDRQTNG